MTTTIAITPLLEGLWAVVRMAWPVLLILGVAITAKIIFDRAARKSLQSTGLPAIEAMDPLTFEKYLEALFVGLGYKVEKTRAVGDNETELLADHKGVRTVVQAKRYQNKVGVKAIEEAAAARGYYSGSRAIVVTNNYFTPQAIRAAQLNAVELWNRDALIRAMQAGPDVHTFDPQASQDIPVQADAENGKPLPVCSVCGQTVSESVYRTCVTNWDQFGGRVYCFEHQKSLK